MEHNQRPIALAPKETPKDSPSSKDSANGNGEPLMPYTCLTCARRKVKCDKIAPKCSTCRKARLECVYQEPAPRKRKRKPAEDVHERLEQYEKILSSHGLLPGMESNGASFKPETSEPQWPFMLLKGDNKEPGKDTGKLVGSEDKARYIGSTVFKNLGDELEVSSDEEEEGATEAAKNTFFQQPAFSDPLSMAMLSPATTHVSLLDYHPTYETAMKLWKLYMDNVDPVVKAVHVPTMQKILQRAAAQPSSVPKPAEALLFAIYHFGIISMDEDDCFKMFGETRVLLLAKYESALRQALVNVQWLKSTNMAVVQAFILYLLSVRGTHDPQTFWVLTGVAVRLGQRIGLHRDGDELGLGPFETQMRRRVFWQLLPLDGLAGQLSGTGICITLDSWSTKQPLNLNDNDIWPGMTEQPEPHTGATDMMFCLARTEMAKIVRTAFQSSSENTFPYSESKDDEDYKLKMHHLDLLEDDMESKYLRYCDFGIPAHQLTMAMARAGINGGRLRIRLPRARLNANLPDDERRQIWDIANKVMSYHISANTNPQLKRFWWHLKSFFQSDTLVWILNELQRDPGRYKDQDSWTKIEDTYNSHPDLLAQKRSLHMAVGRLTVKAWDATQTWRQQNNLPPLSEPAFIFAIRNRPSRRESTYPSNDPTPESAAASSYTYNAFNPGDASEDLVMPFQQDPTFGMGSTAGTMPAQMNAFGGFGPMGGHIFNELDFGQMVDAGTGTGGVDWVLWDRLAIENNVFAPT